eukprot:COSAG05_NODE_8836_length_667_cov_1.665493_2_plen_93_part_00
MYSNISHAWFINYGLSSNAPVLIEARRTDNSHCADGVRILLAVISLHQDEVQQAPREWSLQLAREQGLVRATIDACDCALIRPNAFGDGTVC